MDGKMRSAIHAGLSFDRIKEDQRTENGPKELFRIFYKQPESSARHKGTAPNRA